MRDGVGERLISLNPASINVPAYKNAGWGAAAEIRRTYSPPIPSGAGAEYFTNPPPKPISLGDGTFPAAVTSASERRGNGDAGNDNTLAGLTSHFSNESTELAVDKPEARRRKRRERELHREDDDSSDMSDDSDDDESSQAWVSY
jgi:hypothetical protein